MTSPRSRSGCGRRVDRSCADCAPLDTASARSSRATRTQASPLPRSGRPALPDHPLACPVISDLTSARRGESWRTTHVKAHGTAATVAVGLLTMACGYTVKTSSDYDHSVNFEKYQTFSVRTGNSSGRVVDDQRIAADVAAALRAKGSREVPENEARATVVVHTSTRTTHTNETFYDGWGGGGWGRAC